MPQTSVIERQRAAGLRTVTDGELRRQSWHMDFICQIGGVRQVAGQSLHVHLHSSERDYDYARPAMQIGELSLERTIYAEAFSFLRDHAQMPKLTIPSPSMVHYRGGDSSIDRDATPRSTILGDQGVYRERIAGVYELGCRYLQLDDTSLAYVNDPAQREHIAAIGGDPDHLHEQYISAFERCALGRRLRPRGHEPHVPRQQTVDVGGRAQLRVRGRGAVRRVGGRRVLPGVRR